MDSITAGAEIDLGNGQTIILNGVNATDVTADIFTVDGEALDGGIFQEANVAPELSNALVDQAASEDAAFSYQFAAGSFSDSNGDTLTYTTSALPAWLAFDASTRTFSGTPVQSDVGTVTVTVTAEDPDGETAADTFDIVVGATNDAPVNAVPAAQTTNEDTSKVISGISVSDADNASLIVILEVAQGTLTLNDTVVGGLTAGDIAGNGTDTVTLTGTAAQINATLADAAGLTYDPTSDYEGSDTLTITSSDGTLTDVDTVGITVSAVNDDPTVANAIANQAASEDAAFSYQFASNVFADVDGDTLTYTATLVGGGALPAWLAFDDSTRTFSGTPAQSDVGTISVRVTADDSNGGTVTEDFDITIAAVNDVPTIAGMVTTATYLENTVNAAATIIDSNVTLADVDSTDFNGGNVTAAWTGGGAEDQLSVANIGNGAGQIGVAGANVSYGGTLIGTKAGGTNGASLVITLNASASVAAVEALLEALTYQNTSDTPAASRTLSITVDDGDGGTSASSDITIDVTAEDDTTTHNMGAGNDNITGTAVTDIFEVAGGDLNASDTIAGAGGSDVLKITSGTGTINTNTYTNMTGIEEFEFDSNAAHNITIGNGYYTGITGTTVTINTTSTTGITVNASVTSPNTIQVNSGSGSDNITSGSGNDTINAGDGNNYITAGAGNDYVVTGTGNDTILGGTGTDTVDGGSGFEYFYTQAALVYNNSVDTRIVNIELIERNADVAIDMTINDAWFTQSGYAGNNFYLRSSSPAYTATVTFDGSGVTNTSRILELNGGAGNDSIIGGAGNDSIYGFGGTDTVDGGGGFEYFYTRTAVIYDNSVDTRITNIELIERNADVAIDMTINDAWFTQSGYAGNVFYLRGSNSAYASTVDFDGSGVTNSSKKIEANGGAGNDSIITGAGDDTIYGFGGTDTVDGGGGFEYFYTRTAVIYDNSVDTRITNIELIERNADVAIDMTINDAWFSQTGYSGNNFYLRSSSTAYTTTVDFDGSAVTNGARRMEINGGANNDTLIGGAGIDTITGNGGVDTIQGGGGADVMYGNSGADIFVYTAATDSGNGANQDGIYDFSQGEGDKIDLSAFAGTFTFQAGGNGAADLTGSVAQISYQFQSGYMLIHIDTDGDNADNFEIALVGNITLTAADFIL